MIEQTVARCGDRGRFQVAEPLPFPAASYDGVTCSLALHYLGDWTVPLVSFASPLRPGGWVVLSLDHPFGPPLPSQQGGYFDLELVADTWRKADIEVTQHFWRRPLSAVVDSFAAAGFVIDRVAEPQPTRAAIDRFPELAVTDGIPCFIVYRLTLR